MLGILQDVITVFGHTDKVCMAVINEENKIKEGNDSGNTQRSKGKGVMDSEGFVEVVKKGGNIGASSSKSFGGAGNIGGRQQQNYQGNYGNNYKRSSNRGNGGNKGGVGKGRNGKWGNTSVSHWNWDKNQAFEASTAKGKHDGGEVQDKEKITVGLTSEGVNKVKNVNRFEVLGSMVDDIVESMEEDVMNMNQGVSDVIDINAGDGNPPDIGKDIKGSELKMSANLDQRNANKDEKIDKGAGSKADLGDVVKIMKIIQ